MEPFRKVIIVDDLEQSRAVCQYLLTFEILAIDVEGIDLSSQQKGVISLLQIAVSDLEVYIFDALVLGNDLFCACHLLPVLSNPRILKLCYDCRGDCDILYHKHGVQVFGFYDVQILYTLLFQKIHDPFLKGLHKAMQVPGLPFQRADIDAKVARKCHWQGSVQGSLVDVLERPLKKEFVEYCAVDVSCLFPMYYQWHKMIPLNVIFLMTSKRISFFLGRKTESKIIMSCVDFEFPLFKYYAVSTLKRKNKAAVSGSHASAPSSGVISLKA